MTINKKPFQLTNQMPENRNGTKSYRGYMGSLYCNIQVNQSRCLNASQRQWAKAEKLVRAGVRSAKGPGPTIRACMKSIWINIGEDLDDGFYGHP